MLFSGVTHFLLCFMLYSVAGWLCETVWCSAAAGKFINRGFLNGPYCPVYGCGAALVTLFAQPLVAWPPLVFLVSVAAATALEYFTGWLLETLFQTRWWDYTGRRFQLRGRVCLRNSAVFGLLGLAAVYLLQPAFDWLVRLVPSTAQRLLASMLVVIFIADLIRTLASLAGLEARLRSLRECLAELEKYEREYKWLDKNDIPGSLEALRSICSQDRENERASEILTSLDGIIGRRGEGMRVIRAFPGLRHRELGQEFEALRRTWHNQRGAGRRRLRRVADRTRSKAAAAKIELRLAYKGVTFSRMAWVFLIACVIGYLVESLFCLATQGFIESRQGMLYGPFSQVYGFGAVLMVLILSPLAHKGDGWLFFGSAVIGGLFEAGCSLAQELVFGTVSWEYSDQSINFLGGRTSLLYMFFWGVLGSMYIKLIYPRLASLIDGIPKRPKRFFTWVIVLLLAADMLLSAAAVYRWGERQDGAPAQNAVAELLDRHYPDSEMAEIYPNMQAVDK